MNAFERIPDCMKALNQWVCIHAGSKIPMMALAHKAASSTDPNSWSSFEAAANAVKMGRYENLGFVFCDNGLVAIDIDTGYDEDGFLSPLAADIIGQCESYTEKSRSGRGFHIIVRGSLPFKGKNNLNGVEIYKISRYFIMTGDVMLYDQVRENQAAVDYVVRTYFPDAPKEASAKFVPQKVYKPRWDKPQDGRIKTRPVYPRITPGSRNLCLTSLAGMLHNQGYSREQIYDELSYCNDVACDPSLDGYEIETIVNSVTRYKR